jgi:hypothetical protein
MVLRVTTHKESVPLFNCGNDACGKSQQDGDRLKRMFNETLVLKVFDRLFHLETPR